MIGTKVAAKPRVETGDEWVDRLLDDLRNPAKVLLFVAALGGFVWFVVSVVVR